MFLILINNHDNLFSFINTNFINIIYFQRYFNIYFIICSDLVNKFKPECFQFLNFIL